MVQKRGPQPDQSPENRRWHSNPGVPVCGPRYKEQGVRNQETSMQSNRLTAHLLQGAFPDFLCRSQCPRQLPISPPISTTYATRFSTTASLISLLAGSLPCWMWKTKQKGKSLPFRWAVGGGKNRSGTKDRLELCDCEFCCSEDQQKTARLGLCCKGSILGSTRASRIRVCMLTRSPGKIYDHSI